MLNKEKVQEEDSGEIEPDKTMIVAISIKRIDRDSGVCEVFSKSKYFIFYDFTTNTQNYVLNPYSSELGGSGIQSAQFLIEHNIEVLITKDIGTSSLRIFKSANIKVFSCPLNLPSEAIKYFKQNKLLLIDMVESIHLSSQKNKRIIKNSFKNIQ